MDALELGARSIKAARARTRCQQQPVIAEAPIAFEKQLLDAGLDPGHPGRGPELDLMLAVELGRMHVGLLALAAQILLGERRALVRSLGLVADQDQAAIEALLAQGLGGHGAGQAGPDDDEPLICGHAFLLEIDSVLAWRRAERGSYPAVRTRPDPDANPVCPRDQQRHSCSQAGPALAPCKPACSEPSMSARSPRT